MASFVVAGDRYDNRRGLAGLQTTGGKDAWPTLLAPCSVVAAGPLPDPTDKAAKHTAYVRHRLMVQSGLTGLWQVERVLAGFRR